MAENLLDRVEAIEQREVFRHFVVAEAQEMRHPVADDAAVGLVVVPTGG